MQQRRRKRSASPTAGSASEEGMGDTGQSSRSARGSVGSGSVLTGLGVTPKWWPPVRPAMAPGMSPAAIHLAGQGSRATTPQTEGSDRSVTTQDWLAPPASAGPVTAAAAIPAGHASEQQQPSPPANWEDSPPPPPPYDPNQPVGREPPPPPQLPPAPAPLVPQLGSPVGPAPAPAQAQAQAQSSAYHGCLPGRGWIPGHGWISRARDPWRRLDLP